MQICVLMFSIFDTRVNYVLLGVLKMVFYTPSIMNRFAISELKYIFAVMCP